MSTVGGPRLSTIPTFQNTYSMDFDGVDDYVDVGEIPELSQTQTFTLSVWLKFDNVSGTQRILGQRFSSANLISFAVVGDEVYPSINGAYGVTTTNLTSGTWYHMALVFDGTLMGNENRLKLYIDGVQESLLPFVGTIPSTTGVNPNPFYLGTDGFTTPNYYGGLMDEVGIFNTAEPIDNLWDGSGKPTDLTPLNPIAWYRMGDNGLYKDPQWLIPSNENKDKVSNYSMEFDGVNDYIDCGNDSSINISGDITLSFWVNIKAQKNFNGILSKIDSSTRNYEILVRSTGQVSFYTINSPTGFTTSTSTIPINTWTHVLVTVESGVAGGVKFYFNGVLDVTTGTQTVVAQTHNLNLGRRSTGGFNLNGKLDDVSIFPRVLTSGEISTISTEPTDLTPLNPSAWWKMGEEATFVYGVNPDGTWTIPDQVGSNDGTSNNLMADSARVGNTPSSENNAVSFNMDEVDRVEDTP